MKFINFYKKFIRDYLKIIIFLINLIKIKNSKLKNSNINILFLLILNNLKKKTFKILKKTFIKVFIFIYFNFNYKI